MLKDELNLCVQRLTETDTRLYKQALEILRVRIKESTSSMTSVPKPLKFLREHYNTIKEVYTKITDKETKVSSFFYLCFLIDFLFNFRSFVLTLFLSLV